MYDEVNLFDDYDPQLIQIEWSSANQLLNDTDSLVSRMNTLIFTQETSLDNNPEVDWVPGDPLYEPEMVDFTAAKAESKARCEPCGVSWKGSDPCWECGKVRPPLHDRELYQVQMYATATLTTMDRIGFDYAIVDEVADWPVGSDSVEFTFSDVDRATMDLILGAERAGYSIGRYEPQTVIANGITFPNDFPRTIEEAAHIPLPVMPDYRRMYENLNARVAFPMSNGPLIQRRNNNA